MVGWPNYFKARPSSYVSRFTFYVVGVARNNDSRDKKDDKDAAGLRDPLPSTTVVTGCARSSVG